MTKKINIYFKIIQNVIKYFWYNYKAVKLLKIYFIGTQKYAIKYIM